MTKQSAHLKKERLFLLDTLSTFNSVPFGTMVSTTGLEKLSFSIKTGLDTRVLSTASSISVWLTETRLTFSNFIICRGINSEELGMMP